MKIKLLQAWKKDSLTALIALTIHLLETALIIIPCNICKVKMCPSNSALEGLTNIPNKYYVVSLAIKLLAICMSSVWSAKNFFFN